MPFLVFQRDYLGSTSGIICGSGSFLVQFGEHLRSGIICGAVQYAIICIRLVRGKFELTNQDSAGIDNFTILVLNRNQITFLPGHNINYSQKGIYNSTNQRAKSDLCHFFCPFLLLIIVLQS